MMTQKEEDTKGGDAYERYWQKRKEVNVISHEKQVTFWQAHIHTARAYSRDVVTGDTLCAATLHSWKLFSCAKNKF